jgi:glutaredoxin-like protein NrdH
LAGTREEWRGGIAMVKLFALSTCPWCRKTKQLLTDNNIEFTFLDVDLLEGKELEQALAEIDKLVERRAFPIINIDGEVIQGFDADRILEAARHAK